MKQSLLFFIVCLFFSSTKAQVVFSPPGATWTYNFFWSAGGNPAAQYTILEKIRYTHDSILGSSTVKVLEHNRFYLDCGDIFPGLTLIRQSGDTVFMRNIATDHNWEILYNFNVTAGQSWETNVRQNPGSTTNLALYTYTIHVDSVKYTTVNTLNLKQLFVRYEKPSTSAPLITPAIITERFGSSRFMFTYYNYTQGFCDADWFQRNLCYTDNDNDDISFSSYPCEYKTMVGIRENKMKNVSINLYPNPAQDALTVDLTEAINGTCQLQIQSITGQELFRFDQVPAENKPELDLHLLPKGLYLLNIFVDGKLKASEKFAKE